MRKLVFALVTGAALVAAPISAQQHPMGAPGAPSVCTGIMAMHMGMIGGGMSMGADMRGHAGMNRPSAGQPGAMPGGIAERHAAMTSLLPPQALLSARETLGLTDDQVSKLEHLQHEQGEAHPDGMAEMSEEWQKAMDSLSGDSPDLDAYKHALEEMSEERIDAHVAMLKTAFDARDVLTDEQRAKLPDVARQVMRRCSMGGEGR